jgi:hypothetical protein
MALFEGTAPVCVSIIPFWIHSRVARPPPFHTPLDRPLIVTRDSAQGETHSIMRAGPRGAVCVLGDLFSGSLACLNNS